MKIWNKSYSLLVVWFIIAILIAAKVKYFQKNIFAYDNFGYYLYLPAAFINHDAGFKDFKRIEDLNKKYNCTTNYYQLMQSPKGGLVIRMYAGTAILLTPAFFVGHGVAILTGYPADGFSLPYQMSVIIFGLLLSIFGLVYARKILLKFFPDKLAATTLLVLYLGTNLLFFTTLGNPMPHAYLFNLYIFLIWFTIRWHEDPSWISAAAVGAFLGIIIAIRPSDLIVVLIPLLWGIYSKDSFLRKAKLVWSHWKQFMLLAFVLMLFALPQLFYWRAQAGEYILSVYTDPGSQMHWSHPNLLNVLFSFRKGWLIYSPLISLALLGIFISLWRNRSIFLFSFIFVALNIYMISCFSSLISYGWRAFIQSYAVLLLPLGVTIEFIFLRPKWVSWLMFTAIALLMYLNVVQAWQTGLGVIDGSRMTKEAYVKVFGKWNAHFPEELYRVKRTEYKLDTLQNINNYTMSMLMDNSFEDHQNNSFGDRDGSVAYAGRYSLSLHDDLEYSPALKVSVIKLLENKDHFWVKANVQIYSDDTTVANEGILVVTIVSKKGIMKYRGISCSEAGLKFVPGQWNNLQFDYLSPEFMPQDAELQVYFWNKGKSRVWIDDFKVYLYKLKD